MSVGTKTNEITAAPEQLRGRDLSGTVTTMDALLSQRPFAQQILDQQGHYLMVVKRSQGNLYEAIALLFDDPAWLPRGREVKCQVHRSVEKGDRRLESRTLESSHTLSDYVDWPCVGQVMRRRHERIRLKIGEVSAVTMFGITSLPHTEVRAAGLNDPGALLAWCGRSRALRRHCEPRRGVAISPAHGSGPIHDPVGLRAATEPPDSRLPPKFIQYPHVARQGLPGWRTHLPRHLLQRPARFTRY